MKCEQLRRHDNKSWQMSADYLREQLGLPKKLPQNTTSMTFLLVEVNGRTTELELRPFVPTRHKSSTHRMYARCWECDKAIPAGRMNQHYKIH